MTPGEIARRRAANLRLSAPSAGSPADLVAWLGAVQSQDVPFGQWSIAQRLSSAADVDAAITAGAILRTHILRPTWHFVARDDLRWMQALTSPRVLVLMGHADRGNGVDAALIARGTKAVASAIARRGHMTRREVAAVLAGAGIKTTPWVVGELLMHAEMRAIVCSGAPRGRHQTYALVDERAPRRVAMSREEMLAELTRRYFLSHGPATAKDYQWWSGLSGADVARGIDMLGRSMARVRSGDRTYLVHEARRSSRPARARAQIIQTFDELVVGYRESRDIVDLSGAVRDGSAGGAALLTRGVVHDGQFVGRWRFAPARGARALVLEPLKRLSSAEREAVAAAASRFERFYFRDSRLASRGSH
jgi:DNA glycosylase AlkZ-like